jgi:hypothetical protein
MQSTTPNSDSDNGRRINLRRIIFGAATVAVVAGSSLAGTAAAAPTVPGGEFVPAGTFAAGNLCPFAVQIDFKSGQVQRSTLPNGIQIITGPGAARVTNTDTGASKIYNASGPTKFDPETNRVTVTGLNLIPAPAGQGGPFLWLTSGKVSFVLNNPIETRTGHITDVCAELG